MNDLTNSESPLQHAIDNAVRSDKLVEPSLSFTSQVMAEIYPVPQRTRSYDIMRNIPLWMMAGAFAVALIVIGTYPTSPASIPTPRIPQREISATTTTASQSISAITTNIAAAVSSAFNGSLVELCALAGFMVISFSISENMKRRQLIDVNRTP